MHILMLATGGTIASQSSREGIRLAQKPLPLCHRYREEVDPAVEFTLRTPYQILSENLSPRRWESLLGPLLSEDLSGFDGVLVTHGSDTLSYTAAMAGLLLSHLPLPVVLTAADKPLEHPQSNGWENFRAAVELIRTGAPGVYVTYRNPGETAVTVFGWEEILQADCALDRFSSQASVPFGQYTAGKVTLTRLPLRWNTPLCAALPVLNRKVMQLLCYPGLDLRQIQPRPETAAVLLRLYHSGTAPVEGEEGAAAFLEQMERIGISCYLLGSKLKKEARYVTAYELSAGGGKFLSHRLTPEAAYCGLLLAVNQPNLDPEDIWKRVLG